MKDLVNYVKPCVKVNVIMYCNEVWDCVQESKLQQVTIIQAKTIRMTCNINVIIKHII